MAEELLEHEVLERADIDRIMAAHGHQPRGVSPVHGEAKLAAAERLAK